MHTGRELLNHRPPQSIRSGGAACAAILESSFRGQFTTNVNSEADEQSAKVIHGWFDLRLHGSTVRPRDDLFSCQMFTAAKRKPAEAKSFLYESVILSG